jgi:tetratricopeptide (TPR) repeat protein
MINQIEIEATSRPVELVLPEPELVLSEPEARPLAESLGLTGLALAVTAHLRGNPGEALEHLQMLPSGEDFAESLTARAQLRMELHEYKQAAADFDQLTTLQPENPEGYFQSGVCYFHLSRFAPALERFEKASQLDSARVDFLTAQGTCLLQLKQPEEALAVFRDALGKSPDLEAALLGQACALHMSYELEDAEQAYRQVLARNPASVEALTNMVILGQQKKDDTSVREHARRLLALDPDSEPALLALASVSLAAGAFEAATVHCARLARIRPEQHDYWYNLGVAEERRGDLQASARAFENAASAQSSSAAAYLACAAVYEKIGDPAAAGAALDRVLRISSNPDKGGPEQTGLRIHIALLAERQGRTEDAIAIYESVLAADPSHSDARFRLGYSKLERHDYQGASQDFEACLARRPNWREAEINLSLAYSKLNRPGDAQAVLDRLLAREPGTPEALRGSAAVSLLADPAHSLERLVKLQEEGDRSPEVLFNTGILHQQAGELQQAIDCYREALSSNPRYAEALVNLGHALMATGDQEAARESWAAAVELNPALARGYYK